jgi:hypothetical protein
LIAGDVYRADAPIAQIDRAGEVEGFRPASALSADCADDPIVAAGSVIDADGLKLDAPIVIGAHAASDCLLAGIEGNIGGHAVGTTLTIAAAHRGELHGADLAGVKIYGA